jgi:hypothetical protein
MTLKNSGKQLTAEIIRMFEQQFNVTLPKEYTAFLKETNGGMPEEDLVFAFFDEVTERLNHSVIQNFFVLYTEENYEADNLKNNCIQLWDEMALGYDMLPFGQDPGGDYLCLSLCGDDCGSVYLCNHEYEDSETGFLVKSKVADSFSAFLSCLNSDEE